MKKLFGNELCNTGRQIEFDIAKAICILGMVFVHCFEYLSIPETSEDTTYFVMVIVLDAMFGAATFMSSMGLGIAYSWKNDEDYANFVFKRGLLILFFGFLLGFFRYGIWDILLLRDCIEEPLFLVVIADTLMNDIMPFAGLALMLFGLLKKLKISDKGVLIVALVMSLIGSFVRLIYIEDVELLLHSEILGLFIGVIDPPQEEYAGCFPLFNWFIIVVLGYLYGKALQRCKDIHKYYKISLPVSAAVVAAYLAIAIPNGLGMMNGEIYYYYHMTTFDAFICLMGMVFATSLYHFISLILGDKVKKILTRISSNINRIYCIHWLFIGCIDCIFISISDDIGLNTTTVFIVGTIIFIVSNVLAEIYTRFRERKALAKTN